MRPARPSGNARGRRSCAGGHLTVEGPYYDDGTNTTLTITGGTGKYTGATGHMLLHARGTPLGSEYDFVFHLAG